METELLKCKLTTVQITERGQRLAAIREEEARIAEEKKTMNDVYKSRLSDLTKEANTLAREINEKAERREVEVVEERDFAAREARTIRLDTDEVIRTRVLTPEELARPPLFDFADKWREARSRGPETAPVNETKDETAPGEPQRGIQMPASSLEGEEDITRDTFAIDLGFDESDEPQENEAPELARNVEDAVENQTTTDKAPPKKLHWRVRKAQLAAERAAQANNETN